MTITGWLIVGIIFGSLYWMGLKLNPPQDYKPIIPEPNNLLEGDDE